MITKTGRIIKYNGTKISQKVVREKLTELMIANPSYSQHELTAKLKVNCIHVNRWYMIIKRELSRKKRSKL